MNTSAVRCGLAAHASVRVPVEQLAALRRNPGPAVGEPLAANLLRHSDEQTVVALAAVLDAAHRFGLKEFRDWGVVAAPRYVGRTSVAHALPRYLAEGPWGVSPHIIPHRSLHSVSGTISQALGLHGPNFAVGGGPGSEAEALLAGVSLLYDARPAGVWVVMSHLSPEGPCDARTGQAAAGTLAIALALALVPITAATAVTLDVPLRHEALAGPHAALFAREPR